MNILITGGHLTPALAVIDFLRKKQNFNFVFTGRIWSQKSNKQKAHEKDEIKKRNIKFIPVESGDILNPSDFFSLFKKIKKAEKIIVAEKIDLVFSFGSFIALPFAIAAFKLKIPVITHEQTAKMGLTNKFISFFANKILLTYPLKTIFSKKTEIIGNFLRENLTKKAKKPSWFNFSENEKILYITGGSQGALFINNLIKNNLEFLLKNFIVIHQCGNPTKTNHYENELKESLKKVDKNLQKKYYVKPWIKQDELAYIYQNCDLIIARSGANTVFEISYFKIPAFFIPYPYARFNEQFENAKKLEIKKQCFLVEQNQLSADNFSEFFLKFINNLDNIDNNLKTLKVDNNLKKVEKIVNQYH